MEKQRLANIDLFKIVCIVAVIIVHVSSSNAFDPKYAYLFNKNFSIINFYNMLTRFCVPGFVMVSGMFLLNKDIDIKRIFKKYIFRSLVLYIIFSTLYAIVYYYEKDANIISTFISGYYHLWYLYLLIGLYLVTPILRKIISDKKLTLYFIILCFTFSIIIPFIISLFNLKKLEIVMNHLNLYIPMGYVVYFVTGYYLSKNKVNNKLFYILGIIGTIVNYILFYKLSYSNELYNRIDLMPGTFFQSIAIFLFFKNLKIRKNAIISYISSLICGIYLVHVFIIKLIFYYFPYIVYKNAIVSILFVSIIVFILSLLISVSLKKIPILKRFL